MKRPSRKSHNSRVSRLRRSSCIALSAMALLVAQAASAATLFGIVSDRAAPLAAEAARSHLAAHPGDRIVLRTPAQFLAAPEKQARRWINEADGVLAVAVFADPARRLNTLLPGNLKKNTRFIAINGDARLSRLSRFASGNLDDFPAETLGKLTAETIEPDAFAATQAHPGARAWLSARQTWQAGGENNVANLFGYLLDAKGRTLPAATAEPSLRVRVATDKGMREWTDAEAWQGKHMPAGPALVVIDLANADTASADALCAESRRQGLACVSVLSRWGKVSREATERLPQLIAPAKPAAVVVLQDFVIGAAEGREAVVTALNKLNVPVIKAIRLSERSALQWRLSPDGLPPDSVQYRVALPELQGAGSPIVIAAAGRALIDKNTGLEVRRAETLPNEITRLVARAVRWQKLAAIPNRDKRVAIVYYNHPPGRQNIGADNLDVPASLLEVLRAMKAAGYTTGELPATSNELLDRIMATGVNLPEDREALRHLAGDVNGVTQADYARWFGNLPPRTRGEMVQGPLGRLHAEVLEAEQAAQQDVHDKNASGTDAAAIRALGRRRVDTLIKEMHHLAEGANHPRRADAMQLLDKLHAGYDACLADDVRGGARPRCDAQSRLKNEITALGIEGLRGWGEPPGKVMVEGERLLVPGIQFGNIFIGPQPPRGWEVNEELLHANTSIPPPHQYLAFYHWIRDNFKADAVVHMGRHSTYEFLPGKAVGLTGDDYPSLIASDLPGIYPYIVDGVGEGIQAKRRGLAVMVDHLTPPLVATQLYDKILELRQVVESYEAASSDTVRDRAAQTMREQVEALHLRTELEASMAGELEVRGIGFDQADNDLLAHEIGHYLTKLQEKFMPHGLHVFGKPWTRESLDLMLDSMKRGGLDVAALEPKLADSPRQEMLSLLNGLAGGFVPPGKGNDPLRSPEVLPTGRNFHAIDGDILPTKLGYKLGAEMAAQALAKNSCRRTNSPVDTNARPSTGSGRTTCVDGSEAVILWASDAVRDEGVMVAFSLALLGAEPVWNARGIVTDVHLLPLDKNRPQRRDVVITASGLFRDLYPNLLNLIDRAGRMALAASAATLVKQRPELQEGLATALAPLGKIEWGNEDPNGNRLAARWVQRADAMHAQGQAWGEAGREAAWRIFGDAPGGYGAGVNRLTERSGAWRERDEIGKVYLTRIGHVYGMDGQGEAAHAAFDEALKGVTRSYHGRASNLYGLMDNNDAFDYLGGLSLGVETLTGRRPEAFIVQHADTSRASVEPLAAALLSELRGRFLNPAWIKPLMNHGYAGARTMGQEFVENLWGWQVTRPDLIQSWAWDDVKSVYFDDAHKLGLPQYLAQGHNAHVKAHMLAVFMVAAQKGYWKTDDATVHKMGSELAQLVNKNGLPGSGHTSPTNPMWTWLKPHLDAADAKALDATLARARDDGSDGSTYASAASGAPKADSAPAAPAPSTAATHNSPPEKTPSSKPVAKASAAAPGTDLKQRAYELLPENPVARGAIGIVALALTILLGFGILRGAKGNS